MATTQIGTTLDLGAGTLTNYIVLERGEGDADVDQEDIRDGETGQRVTRIVYQIDGKIELQMLALSAANPATDFPKGLKCTVTSLTAYMVDDCKIRMSRGPTRVDVTLTNIGI